MKLLDQITWPPPGRYLVALSGGVDSVALLQLLAQRPTYELVAAYIDHGWRDTAVDVTVVRQVTKALGIELRIEAVKLQTRSESEARQARYAALERLRRAVGAVAIITAHHADDQVETVALNALRGGGRQGLGGLRSTATVWRPLLNVSKSELTDYARHSGLDWAEDPTNTDRRYRRNWVRHELLAANPQLKSAVGAARQRLQRVNTAIDELLAARLTATHHDHGIMVSRSQLQAMSAPVLQEALLYLGRQHDPAAEFNYRQVEQLAVDLKTGRLQRRRPLSRRLFVECARGTVAIEFKAP